MTMYFLNCGIELRIQKIVDEVENLKQEIKDCGHGFHAVKCLAKLAIKIEKDITTLPAKIEADIAATAVLITKLKEKVKDCASKKVDRCENDGKKILESIAACGCQNNHFSKSHQYADDFQLILNFPLSRIHDAINNINHDLDCIAKVSSARLNLNEDKEVLMVVGGQRGIQSVKLKLCESLILSYILYCDVVYWPNILNKDKESLQRVQHACIRFCYGLRKFDHISTKFNESKWLNLAERFELHLSSLVYKIDKFKTPLYLYDKLVKGSDIHSRETRHHYLYSVPKHVTTQFERLIGWLGGRATLLNPRHPVHIGGHRNANFIHSGRIQMQPMQRLFKTTPTSPQKTASNGYYTPWNYNLEMSLLGISSTHWN
ncbi:hypothetical protein NQ317_016426 [Molorchus minor]|uniref:Uncharacterized protein n=1 Tax=Molorchus minor TaxID=1323400 RepID=A0ABQ9JYX8_9CUCU|nr:hypothetical protein NQ317_016426 [Molorchus minor]